MLDELSLKLLKGIKTGSLHVSENGKNSLKIVADGNDKIIDIIDFSSNIPSTQEIFTKLSEAKKFAEKLKEQNITLRISHKGKMVMKLGKEANPKLSRLITRSDAVEITDIRELRILDKRLRLK
ncbi:MAG: hypothetical protein HY295_02460 [Thaumarchaeota archaeon]|nr:hypothetical protein [Nitrososphaerota archaeon]